MKAVLLIGGEATRLRPLTCNRPKAMVPVLNKPFLEYVVRHLSRHEVKDLVLTQRQHSESIQDYFGDGSRFGIRLSYIVEDSPLGTAGAIKNVEAYLDSTFLVLNGDVFTDLDVSAMIAFHRQQRAKATIALTPVDDPTSYGVVETNPAGRVLRFLEKPTRDRVTTNMINAGTYVLEPDVLARVPPKASFSFEHQFFPLLLERNEAVYAYTSHAYWIDIGTSDRYLQFSRDLLSGKGGPGWQGVTSDRVLVGERSHVDPSARIEGPTVMGSRCSIREGAVIERSILWDGVKVEAGAMVRDSIVGNDCRVGEDSVIEGSVLGDHVTVCHGGRLKPGSKIWPGTTVEAEPPAS